MDRQAPYVMVIWREHKVHPNTHILFERSLYSVPWKLIGKKVLARGTASSVTIYRNDLRVATHHRVLLEWWPHRCRGRLNRRG